MWKAADTIQIVTSDSAIGGYGATTHFNLAAPGPSYPKFRDNSRRRHESSVYTALDKETPTIALQSFDERETHRGRQIDSLYH